MTIEKLNLLNFKNIAEAELEFSPGVNCMLGGNGMGKSNLLEAIHFLAIARPMRVMPESSLMRHGTDEMMVKGRLLDEHETPTTLTLSMRRGGRKVLKSGDKAVRRLSEHIGKYPVVTVCPSDTDLICGPGAERRRLMDMTLSQADPVYLSLLARYTGSLESRNRMLRAGIEDSLLYESVERVMAEAASGLHQRRREWCSELAPLVAERHSSIAGSAEAVSLTYRSHLDEAPTAELLARTRSKDRVVGYTTAGVHRDDLLMALGDHDLRRTGSQGQMKTFAIALRLAVFEYIKRHKGLMPMLLLDDIFDKLDSDRVAAIVDTVSGGAGFGQIFITDTNRKHLDDIISMIGGQRTLFEVENGRFTKIEQ